MYKQEKYFIEVPREDYLLSEVLRYFGTVKNLADLSGLSYSTIHHAFHYKGITNRVAVAIEKNSNGKFKAIDLVGIKFSNREDLKYLRKIV